MAKHRIRRWLQFGVLDLLILTTVVAAGAYLLDGVFGSHEYEYRQPVDPRDRADRRDLKSLKEMRKARGLAELTEGDFADEGTAGGKP